MSVNAFIFLIEDNMHIPGGGLTGLESVTIFIITVFLFLFLFFSFWYFRGLGLSSRQQDLFKQKYNAVSYFYTQST